MQQHNLTSTLKGILVSDKNLHILWTNEQLKLLLERPSHHFEGDKLTDFFKIDDVAAFLEQLDVARAAGTSVTRQVRYNRPSGYSITLSFEINPVDAQDEGNPVYHISVGTQVDRSRNSSLLEAAGKRSPAQFRERYAMSTLSFQAAKELFLKLDNKVNEEKLFLDPDFTVPRAAHLLASNDLYLSQAVNFFSGYPFTGYINAKRVGYILEMRERLAENDQPIWRNAGFGSYHAFYRHVRKYHDRTPAELLASVMDTAGMQLSPQQH